MGMYLLKMGLCRLKGLILKQTTMEINNKLYNFYFNLKLYEFQLTTFTITNNDPNNENSAINLRIKNV